MSMKTEDGRKGSLGSLGERKAFSPQPKGVSSYLRKGEGKNISSLAAIRKMTGGLKTS